MCVTWTVPGVTELRLSVPEAGRRLLPPAGRGTLTGYDPQWFTQIVHDAAKAASLPPNRRRSHMLRASFATHLLGDGVPISVVSKLLGHSDIAVTSRYLSVNDVDRRNAVDRLTLPVGSG